MTRRVTNQSPNKQIVFTQTNNVLFQTTTIFPDDLFPDTLTINTDTVHIVTAELSETNQTLSIPLHDIANVQIQTTPFFATIRITNIRDPMQPVVLKYLKKDEAIKAKKLIDKLLTAVSQDTDVPAS